LPQTSVSQKLNGPTQECRRIGRRHIRGAFSKAFANPKSRALILLFTCDLDVCWLEVAMNDDAVVRGFERFTDLNRDIQRFFNRDRASSCVLAALFCARPANASVVMTLNQVGPNVVGTASVSLANS